MPCKIYRASAGNLCQYLQCDNSCTFQHNISNGQLSRLCPCDIESCGFLQGGTLFQVLDDVEPLPRDPLAPFRMSVIDRFKDMGTIAMGKSEAGLVRKNDRLYVMPNKCACTLSLLR